MANRRTVISQFAINLAALLALSACTSSAASNHPDPLSMQGASADDLVHRLGPPQAQQSLGNGRTVMQYDWSSSYVAGGFTTTPDGQLYTGSTWNLPRSYVPEQTVTQTCIVQFTLGPDQRVQEVHTQGDGC
jgi:hypothetical protein